MIVIEINNIFCWIFSNRRKRLSIQKKRSVATQFGSKSGQFDRVSCRHGCFAIIWQKNVCYATYASTTEYVCDSFGLDFTCYVCKESLVLGYIYIFFIYNKVLVCIPMQGQQENTNYFNLYLFCMF
jgi:hypothetical protein